jgi:hypothetical protein
MHRDALESCAKFGGSFREAQAERLRVWFCDDDDEVEECEVYALIDVSVVQGSLSWFRS